MALCPSTIAKLILDDSLPLPASISKAQARHVRELRSAYRTTMAGAAAGALVAAPEAGADLVRPLIGACAVERLCLLPLDARSRVIGEPLILTQGDVDGTDAGPRAVFRAALQAGAVSVWLAHNHPTGECEPSAADRAVTKRLVAAGKTVDIPLVDHVIVTRDKMVSLRRKNPELWS